MVLLWNFPARTRPVETIKKDPKIIKNSSFQLPVCTHFWSFFHGGYVSNKLDFIIDSLGNAVSGMLLWISLARWKWSKSLRATCFFWRTLPRPCFVGIMILVAFCNLREEICKLIWKKDDFVRNIFWYANKHPVRYWTSFLVEPSDQDGQTLPHLDVGRWRVKVQFRWTQAWSPPQQSSQLALNLQLGSTQMHCWSFKHFRTTAATTGFQEIWKVSIRKDEWTV